MSLATSPDLHRFGVSVNQESGSGAFYERDEFSSNLQALEHYTRSHLAFQRLTYGQGIAAAAVGHGYVEVVEVLLPLVEQLCRDHEPEIRSVAVQQIVGLGTALHDKDAERSLRDIEASLLVCAQQCALDDEEEVAQAAVLAFKQLAQLLPAARATAAAKRAVDRLEARGSDDGSLAAVRLLAHTLHCWTPEALRRHVPRYINRWSNHRDFSVREAVATCMSLVVGSMPLNLTHQLLLPFLHQLCRDSNWRVRRAASSDLPRVAQVLQQQQLKLQAQKQEQQQHGHNALPEQEQQQQQQQGERSRALAIGQQPGQQQGPQQQEQGACPDGLCSGKASTSLHRMRLSGDYGSTGNLASGHTSPGVPHRNRSTSALAGPRPAATTAQIMTKHPMHSSLITDGLLAAESPASSTPGSPSSASAGQQERTLLSPEQPPAPAAAAAAGRGGLRGGGTGAKSAGEAGEGAAGPACRLEQTSPIVHDCWCGLRQCMELLTADSSHWVKVAALSGLGPFLLLLPGCQVGQLLLGRFTSMAGSTVVIYEISVALACAQHFGPLVARLGAGRWGDMRDAWHALQASRDPAVLSELVACLPQLAACLGSAITLQELLPALVLLVHNHLSWVAGELVAVMAPLLELLPASGQEVLLKVLPQLAAPGGDRTRSWRLRRDLALQLGRMAAAAGPDAVTDGLWSAAITLCCDPVAAVRSAAAGQVGALLAALPAEALTCHSLQQPLEHDGAAAADAAGPRAAGLSSSSSSAASAAAARDVLRCGCGGAAARAAASKDVTQHHDKSSVAGDDDTQRLCQADSCQVLPAEGESTGAAAAAVDDDSSSDHHPDAHSNSSSSSATTAEAATKSSSRSSKAKRNTRRSSSASSLMGGYAGRELPPVNRDRPAPGVVRFQLFGSESVHDHEPLDGHCRRSSLEYDLELPSALSPAPPGFSPAAEPEDEQAGGASAAGPGADGAASLLLKGADTSSGSDSGSSLGRDSSDSSSIASSDSGGGSGSDGDDEQEEKQQASDQQEQGEQQQQAGGKSVSWLEEQEQQQQQKQQLEQLAAAAAAANGKESLSSYLAHPALGRPSQQPAARASSGGTHGRPPHATPPRPVQAPQHGSSSNSRQRGYKSAGDLLTVAAAAAGDADADDDDDEQQQQKQHPALAVGNSCNSRSLPASVTAMSTLGGSSGSLSDAGGAGGIDRGLPGAAAAAAPHEYLSWLLQLFGCSRHHQQRQLFVPLVLGVLAACHDRLSCAAAGQLLDRLEALAADPEPGVRYTLAAALAGVQRQAAALLQQDGGSTAAAAAAGAPGTPRQDGDSSSSLHGTLEQQQEQQQQQQQAELSSYHAYVKQLSERSQACRCDLDSSSSSSSATTTQQQQQPQAAGDACCDGCVGAGRDVAGAAGPQWLTKLNSCQQLERLLGVAALSTGAC